MTEISLLVRKRVHLKISKIMLARALNKLTTVSCVILYFGNILFEYPLFDALLEECFLGTK